MLKAILVDLNNVILIPKDSTTGIDPATLLFLDINDYFEINNDLLAKLKVTTIPVYAFTALNTLLNNPSVKSFLAMNFKQVFSEKLLGLDKQSSYAYEFIAKSKLGLKTDQVLFIDDSKTNIQAAKNTGMLTLLYTNKQDIISELKNML
jgi:FMN phosphatase YigB (HAD superfamily)